MTSPTEPALVLDGVVAGYGGGDVLRGVTFSVPESSVTCVVGPNGAGKSTLMRVISGLLRPRLGTVMLRGEKLTSKSPRQVRRERAARHYPNGSPSPRRLPRGRH